MTIDTAELSCSELVTLVTDYFEGALGSEDSRRFEAHLTDCDGCTEFVHQLRQTIELTGTLREEDVSPEAEAKLLAAFRHWKR